jgi:hypothetical protein
MGPTMKSKANAKIGLLNQQISDIISWNQLTSVNVGGGDCKIGEQTTYRYSDYNNEVL